MRSPWLIRFLPAVLVLSIALHARAQGDPIGTWTIYPSLQSVNAVAASDTDVWSATTGGVFAANTSSGEIRRFTRTEGLSSVSADALVWDEDRGVTWVGHQDGALDRIDGETGTVDGFFDIRRADQFTSRAINRLRIQGDSLVIATEFGLVVFDAARGEVRDSYTRLGPLESGTAVFDALFAPLPDAAGSMAGAPGLWLATDLGVVWAPRSGNLREPAAWTLDPDSPLGARSLHYAQDRVWLGTTGFVYEREPAGWIQRLSGGRTYSDFIATENTLFALDPIAITDVRSGGPRFNIRGHFSLTSAVLAPDGTTWIGDQREGLASFPALDGLTTTTFERPAQSIVPNGPVNNITRSVAIGPDGTVWLAHGDANARSGVSRLSPDGTWEMFSSASSDVPRVIFYDTFVDRDGTFYGGTYGRGLVEIRDQQDITVYNESNSSLLRALDSEGYVEALDAVRDRSGALWVTNVLSGRPFHVQVDGVWTPFPAYPGVPNRSPRRLFLDRFGYIWFTLDETQGGGMGAIDSRGTPDQSGDDDVFVLSGAGSGGTGLPHPNVRALAEDPDGRLWIGTERGLAFILSPGSAFGSDPALAQPVWARIPDGTSYFLRDLFIFDLAVDPAGQKWIGSTAGAWLTNTEGNEVLEQFTADNSPLLDDEVLSIAVDPASGKTYFATSRGLVSYQSATTAPTTAGGDLEVFPNPLRDTDTDIVIRALPGSDEGPASLKVLTVDGQVVFEAETRGGTFVWPQPRDRRTGRPLAPGVYVIAVAGDAGTSYGKLAVIR